MLKQILVPLDGSNLAETALPYATQIVENDGQITLLMVVEIPPTVSDSPLFPTPTKATDTKRQFTETITLIHANDYLDQIEANLHSPNLKIEKIVRQGEPAGEIVDFAENASIDAIVMSTHGRTGLSRWILGSVTHKVIGASPCPIFVVPRKE